MHKQDSQQLTEVQPSLPASTPVLSVQSSYKQSLENLNLQAWCMQHLASWSKCTSTAQKVGVSRIFRALRAYFLVCGSSLLEVLDPPLFNPHIAHVALYCELALRQCPKGFTVIPNLWTAGQLLNLTVRLYKDFKVSRRRSLCKQLFLISPLVKTFEVLFGFLLEV